MYDLIVRHSLADRLLHWFNAACWITLFFTGAALMANPDIAPLGAAFDRTVGLGLRSLIGPGGLLALHMGVGAAWLTGIFAYVLLRRKDAAYFLRQVFNPAKGDLTWLIRKIPLMVLGGRTCERFGLPTNLPEQNYYNAGQKAFGVAAVCGCLLLALSGLGMAAHSIGFYIPGGPALVRVFIVIHLAAACLLFLGLLVHVYMAAVSPAERPGLKSMLTGTVPFNYAKSHHALWLEEKTQGKDRCPAQD